MEITTTYTRPSEPDHEVTLTVTVRETAARNFVVVTGSETLGRFATQDEATAAAPQLITDWTIQAEARFAADTVMLNEIHEHETRTNKSIYDWS